MGTHGRRRAETLKKGTEEGGQAHGSNTIPRRTRQHRESHQDKRTDRWHLDKGEGGSICIGEAVVSRCPSMSFAHFEDTGFVPLGILRRVLCVAMSDTWPVSSSLCLVFWYWSCECQIDGKNAI